MKIRNLFRWLNIVFCPLLLLAFAGCQIKRERSTIDADKSDRATPRILSTIAPIEVLVSAIGGDRIKSECLIVGELDPHSYQLVKGDREKMRRAHLVVYLGLGLEHGPSLAASLQSSANGVCLGEWMLAHHSNGILRSKGSLDPHIWMDIGLWSGFLEIICRQLTELMPQFGGEFQERTTKIRREFDDMHCQVRELMQRIPDEQRFLVTTHDAFRYFARAYLAGPCELDDASWKERVMSPEGLAPESQISLKQMQKTLEYLARHRVGVVFAESNVNHQSLAKIVQSARAKNVPVQLATKRLYGDTMPPYAIGPKGYRAYLEMIHYNAEIISTNIHQQVASAHRS